MKYPYIGVYTTDITQVIVLFYQYDTGYCLLNLAAPLYINTVRYDWAESKFKKIE